MFRGHCPTRLDEKGRLKIPADFKHEIDKSYDGRFYLTSMDGAVVKLYPMTEWEQFEAQVLNGAGSYEQKDKFQEAAGFYGQVVEMDSQGRLTIPERHREKFGLKDDVGLLGKGTHLEIRIAAELAKKVEANPVTLQDLNDLLKRN